MSSNFDNPADRTAEDYVWYFAYANYMNESALQNAISTPSPSEVMAVVAENAWLSFDYCGIPFVEPAYPSLIIKGSNDTLQNRTLSDDNNTTYLRYIHDRCFPGIEFTPPGELPPPVEGIAYRITAEQMSILSEASGFRVAQIRCTPLGDTSGQASPKAGKIIEAYCLVAQEKYRSSCLMPTITSYAPVYRGALTHGFSLDYMRHLSQLRPYNLAYATPTVRAARTAFVVFVLAPQFAVLYLPLVAAQRVLGGIARETIEKLKLVASDIIRYNAILAERYLFRPIVGRAGYLVNY